MSQFQEMVFMRVCEVLNAYRCRQDRPDIHEIMGELRASMKGKREVAMVRLFRGYTE